MILSGSFFLPKTRHHPYNRSSDWTQRQGGQDRRGSGSTGEGMPDLCRLLNSNDFPARLVSRSYPHLLPTREVHEARSSQEHNHAGST
jgi:hypothetical protein